MLAFSTRSPVTARLRLARWKRSYATPSSSAGKSPHAAVYTSTFPAMIPVFLLGSAVYLGLQLTQMNLSHEKYMSEATARVEELEGDIKGLREKRASISDQTSTGQESPSPPSGSSRWRLW
ncbi:hypothetical protein CPB83DRAFT_803586 [Crepidotus variabilis]|uniref:Uncharacterized protein n=1 Tax=Crepidotus variabilis TaxID=179855 RepID=A0A9P6ES50_9AGAR|nr:hypothetical protein CPB83DRAFT_803586 [Crepidotus variabilis]